MDGTMRERIARAIEGVQLFSRVNDWASDRVDGLPIEICRYGAGGEDEIVVVRRFPPDVDESKALAMVVGEHRADAVLDAMRSPDEAMIEAGALAIERTELDDGEKGWGMCWKPCARASWQAQIDAARTPAKES